MIPKTAKRVFKGILFDVYQWEQKQYDGSYSTFEKLKRIPTVDVIAVTEDKKILVLKQKQPGRNWYNSLPAGKIEYGENPMAGAKRELLEETGCVARRMKLFKHYTGTNLIDWPEYLTIAYDCKKVADQKLDPGEKIRVRKVDFDEFLQLCRLDNFVAPRNLKFMMYEALLNTKDKKKLYTNLFG